MKILLGVTGSISAYKAHDLLRLFINDGHEVIVILSEGALNFTLPQVFLYLGAKAVYKSLDDFKSAGVLHVELGRWCDTFIIAPMSANSLARLARGEASDLLSALFLAFEKTKPILIFPAMNSEMLSHPFVEENINIIKKFHQLPNTFIANTLSGKLACNEEGKGKLLPIEEIKELTYTISFQSLQKRPGKILITTGATLAPLDPVRYLTNSSSGLTGFELAKYFLKEGHQVQVVAGIKATPSLLLLQNHPNYHLTFVKTVNDMAKFVDENIHTTSLFIASAAVTDIEFEDCEHKMKKDQMGHELHFHPSKDILKSVIELNIPHLKIVGFAAETNISDEIIEKKFRAKPVDLLIATKVHNGGKTQDLSVGFNAQEAYYRLRNKKTIFFEGLLLKQDLGSMISTELLSGRE